jgi:hypothetical protein
MFHIAQAQAHAGVGAGTYLALSARAVESPRTELTHRGEIPLGPGSELHPRYPPSRPRTEQNLGMPS